MELKFYPSPNFEIKNNRIINSIILHYTGMKPGEALSRLCDIKSKVSAHYFIDEKGILYQLVEEKNIAWHAGLSKFTNIEAFNKNSIGIEIENPGHDHGYEEFKSAQYSTLVKLCTNIIQKHPIIPKLILGHSDIAPERKIDPGEKFNWKLLYKYGIGILPPNTISVPFPKILVKKNDSSPQVFKIQNLLADYGYNVHCSGYFDDSLEKIIKAFHAHFYQENITSNWDENSQNIIEWLIKN